MYTKRSRFTKENGLRSKMENTSFKRKEFIIECILCKETICRHVFVFLQMIYIVYFQTRFVNQFAHTLTNIKNSASDPDIFTEISRILNTDEKTK